MVLERDMVIMSDKIIQKLFEEISGWSFKLLKFSSAVKTNITGLFLEFVILIWKWQKVNNHAEQTSSPVSPQTEFNTCMGFKNFSLKSQENKL